MYARSITRTHRTAFVVAIDGSGSMAEPIRFRGRSATKAEAVAEVADELLFELIERARRDDGVRDYYDIALIGYGGDDRVESLLPDGAETLTVTELAARRPATLEEFLAVPGVGTVKAQRYGKAFLDAIAQWRDGQEE